MHGAIFPLPQYAFMAWCSVKAQGQLYHYFLVCGKTCIDWYCPQNTVCMHTHACMHAEIQVSASLISFSHEWLESTPLIV